jgi:signal transduction histidine kinase
MTIEHAIIAFSIALGLLVGFLDALVGYFFYHDQPFLALLFLDVPSHDVYVRSVILVSFTFFGLVASVIVRQRRQTEEEAKNLAKFPAEDPFPVMRFDADGKLLYANAAAAPLLSHTGSLPAADAPPEWRQVTAEALQSGANQRISVEDQGRVFSLVVVPVSGADYVNWYGRDVTERRRAARERERLIAELEGKNAELERFTYTVSHDLKSPLISIQGFLGLLEKDAAEGSTEQVRSDIARIRDAADKMRQLLDDLLELSRIGRVINPPEATPLGPLTREVVRLFAVPIAQRAIDLQIAPDLPVVFADRPRLAEVLQNLVDNALKFMGGQPHPRVEIAARQDGNQTVCYVQDNGIGIDPRYHQKVFQLFDQLDPQVEGTGIGLALAKRIIEVHGGRIWVESEGQGKGCTFCFTLPSDPGATDDGQR